MSARVEKAATLFRSGLTCSQAIVGAYGDLFCADTESAIRSVTALGGGFARMRQLCGAVSGMGILASLKYGSTDGADTAAKKQTYAITQQMALAFQNKNGSIVCGELLGVHGRDTEPTPSERTEAYYTKRPCVEYVRDAAEIVERFLLTDSVDV